MSLPASGIASSIVPFDPTLAFTVAASAVLALAVLTMVFFALAPVVSSTWTADPQGVRAVDAHDAD